MLAEDNIKRAPKEPLYPMHITGERGAFNEECLLSFGDKPEQYVVRDSLVLIAPGLAPLDIRDSYVDNMRRFVYGLCQEKESPQFDTAGHLSPPGISYDKVLSAYDVGNMETGDVYFILNTKATALQDIYSDYAKLYIEDRRTRKIIAEPYRYISFMGYYDYLKKLLANALIDDTAEVTRDYPLTKLVLFDGKPLIEIS